MTNPQIASPKLDPETETIARDLEREMTIPDRQTWHNVLAHGNPGQVAVAAAAVVRFFNPSTLRKLLVRVAAAKLVALDHESVDSLRVLGGIESAAGGSLKQKIRDSADERRKRTPRAQQSKLL